MNLEDLPEEILIIIIRKLDVVSLFKLYNVSLHCKNIICSYKVIKTCHLSLTTMNSVRVLQSNFFKDISSSLKHLNLSGMANLTKSVLLQVTKRLKNLANLDVSYTNISILDFIEIYRVCPTIKSISINFNLGRIVKVPKTVLTQCQEVFKNFEHIHFVGKCINLLFSQVALRIIQKSKLETLQYTIVENNTTVYENQPCEKVVQFDYLQICIPVHHSNNSNIAISPNMNDLFLFSKLDYNNYEYIVIVKKDILTCSVYSSPLFEDFFRKHFDFNVNLSTKFVIRLFGNVSVMLWDRKSTTFNDAFFNKLYINIKVYFPYVLPKSEDLPLPLQYDRYIIIPTQGYVERKHTGDVVSFKRRRIGTTNFYLDYDSLFKDKVKIELSLRFHEITLPVSLAPHCTYLPKITHLNLNGNVKYNVDFFKILFRCCTKLVTFNMECPENYDCTALLASSISLSRSIKNLMLAGKRINFTRLFLSLSQCKTLENVQLIDYSPGPVGMPDPTYMFKKCTNLYCFYIYANFDETGRGKKFRMLNRARESCEKKYLNVKIFNDREILYDPFVDVFNICPIKPILLS